jgi:integrase
MPKRNSTKLTDTYIRKSIKPPAKGRKEYFDSVLDGLLLRVSSTGSMSWCQTYRLGRTKRYTIGSYPTYSIAEAREEGSKAKKLAAKGIDPDAARKAQRAEQAAAMEATRRPAEDSIEKMAELFIELYVDRSVRPATARDYYRHFRLYIVPEWKGRTVGTIGRKDIAGLLDLVEIKKGAPVQCNRVRATLSKWFNWMVERGVLDANPVLATKPRTLEAPRERRLSDDELKAIWSGGDQKGWPFGPIVQLLMLTGKRRGEVAGMLWSEIDLDAGTWTIQPERSGTKQRRRSKTPSKPDVAPLSRQTIELIERLPRFGEEDLVFPARNRSGNPVSGFSKANRHISELCGINDWRPHDLRTAVRTNLSALNIRKEVADKVLNHVDGTVDGVHYDFHDYMDQKRDALQAWANRLDKILGDAVGDNVVSIRGS